MEAASIWKISRKLTRLARKSPCSIGNTSSNGGFSIAMLVFGWGIHILTASEDHMLEMMAYAKWLYFFQLHSGMGCIKFLIIMSSIISIKISQSCRLQKGIPQKSVKSTWRNSQDFPTPPNKKLTTVAPPRFWSSCNCDTSPAPWQECIYKI